MARTNRKQERIKRHRRIRKRVRGTEERPRLCVTRSLRHLYAQIIDDDTGRTLVHVSTLDREAQDASSSPNIEGAKSLGARLAEKALEKGIGAVVFDRSGYLYHGVVSAFAQACREGGLRF
ncbi:MAG: 50S ribosomal protein L18 [Candidatus Bipolaricaulia bacterium]